MSEDSCGLVGKKIKRVRHLSDEELMSEGWGGIVACLELNDGSIIYASQDSEGNDAGMLFGREKNGTGFCIVPDKK